ncbi:MAG: monovalent cation/H+ antiporter complex subunit F [Pseudomonadota bacterium]
MINNILQVSAILCVLMAVLLTLLAVWRFADILVKLVALEVLVNLFICGVGIWALHIHFSALLDICIALSLIMFLSTVAYLQFLVKRKPDNA